MHRKQLSVPLTWSVFYQLMTGFCANLPKCCKKLLWLNKKWVSAKKHNFWRHFERWVIWLPKTTAWEATLLGAGVPRKGPRHLTRRCAPCSLAINSHTIWYSAFFADYLLISFITFISLGWSILNRWDVLQLPALLSQNPELPILWHYHIYSFIQTSGQILVSITYCLPPNSNAFSDWTRTCHVSCV